MKQALLFIGIFILMSTVFKKEKVYFPQTVLVSMTGKTVNFPKDAKGKYSVVFVALNQKGADTMFTWVKPMYNALVMVKNNSAVLVEDQLDDNLYYIMAGKGVDRNISARVLDSLKKNHEMDIAENILYYGGVPDTLAASLKITQNDNLYGYVLNYNGVIVYGFSGGYTAAKWKAIKEILADPDASSYDHQYQK